MKPKRLLLDRMLAVYNAVLAGAWFAVAGLAWWTPAIAAAHLAAVSLPWLFARLPARPSPVTPFLRRAYFVLWFPVFWSELGLLHEVGRAAGHDAWISCADLALFGSHLHARWAAGAPQAWLGELMYLSYFLYFAYVFLPPLVAGLSRRWAAFEDMSLRIFATYLACFLVYVIFPVYGPRAMLAASGSVAPPAGFFAGIEEALRAAGDSAGTAFPSSHAAGAVTAAWIGFRWFPRPLAWLYALEALGVVLATVYTGNHYAVDAVAGTALAVVMQGWLLPAGGRPLALRLSGRRLRAPGLPPAARAAASAARAAASAAPAVRREARP